MENVACVVREEKYISTNVKGEEDFGYLGIYGKIILNWIMRT